MVRKNITIGYIALIIIYFLVALRLTYLIDVKMETMHYNFLILPLCKLILNSIFGAILGLDSLIKEIRKKGRFSVDVFRLLIIGIPSLYLSSMYFIYYSSVGFIRELAMPLNTNIYNSTMMSLFQVLLGFSIISSIRKVEK